jgi:ABC-2 type transport system ATP-binding protein
VTSGPRLEAIGLRKCYGETTALAGVDLELEAGSVVTLIGRNGAGKTTLFSVLAGLCRPDGGRVRIEGFDVGTQAHRARRHLGLVGQEIAVYLTLTVRDNLRLFGELGGLRREARDRGVARVAERLDIGALLQRPARTLSGGQLRRLHTAMALMLRPRVLLLDEPTSGVDVTTRGCILDLVCELAEEGAAVCYATHYLAEVEKLDGVVAIIDEGRMAAWEPLRDLVRKHGRSGVELVFEGKPPSLGGHLETEVSDGRLRVFSSEAPGVLAAQVLGELGRASERLRTIDLIRPNLESVFLGLTSRSRD